MTKSFKRSIKLGDRKTSLSVEDEFWSSFREIALSQRKRVQELIAEIDRGRNHANLSCAIRLFVLDYYQSRAVSALPVASPVRAGASTVELLSSEHVRDLA